MAQYDIGDTGNGKGDQCKGKLGDAMLVIITLGALRSKDGGVTIKTGVCTKCTCAYHGADTNPGITAKVMR